MSGGACLPASVATRRAVAALPRLFYVSVVRTDAWGRHVHDARPAQAAEHRSATPRATSQPRSAALAIEACASVAAASSKVEVVSVDLTFTTEDLDADRGGVGPVIAQLGLVGVRASRRDSFGGPSVVDEAFAHHPREYGDYVVITHPEINRLGRPLAEGRLEGRDVVADRGLRLHELTERLYPLRSGGDGLAVLLAAGLG